jgi:Flp pilus assembly protein TadD
MRRDVFRLAAGGCVAFFVITSMQQSFYASSEPAMIKQSLAVNPNNARLQGALGLVYVRNDDYQLAEEHFRKAAELDPWEPRYRISIGKAMADQGRYAEAMAQYATIKDANTWQNLLDANIKAAQAQLGK